MVATKADTTGAGGTGPLSVTSSPVVVSAGAAAALQVVSAPSSSAAGAALSPALSVQVVDAAGNPVTTGPDATAALSLSTDVGASGAGDATGTLSSGASAGAASFASVVLHRARAAAWLTVSKPDTSGQAGGSVATSVQVGPLAVSAGARPLQFTTQPGAAVAGAALARPPALALVDADGNIVSQGSDGSLAVSLSRVDGAALSGASGLSLSAGAATASSLTTAQAGGQVVLSASVLSSAGTLSAQSAAFSVAAAAASQLAFLVQPGGGAEGAAWPQAPVVGVETPTATWWRRGRTRRRR